MSSPSPVEEVTLENEPKRRRVSVACGNCRTRKSRCNGGRPKCSTCSSNGYECLYEQPQGPHLSSYRESNNSTALLEARVEDLEKLLRGARPNASTSEKVPPPQSSADSQRISTAGSIPDFSGEPQGENVDALASIALSDGDDNPSENRYFGGASNISLIHLITTQLSDHQNTQVATSNREPNQHRVQSRISSDLGHAIIRVPGLNKTTDADPLVFPSPARTDQLLHLYFSTIHLFIPCLEERSFLNKYKTCQKGISQSAPSVSGAWLGTFYLVLSLACQCLEARSPESCRAAESEIYYRKAMNAGMKQAIYGTGFEIVQFLVLVVAYLQGTHRSTDTWTFHSLAVKSALQIALYSKRSHVRLAASERILRQKCWLCLVFNDRVMSIAYGRPGLLQRSYCLSVFPIENMEDVAPIHVTKRVAYLSSLHFKELISLSTIAADIAETLDASCLDNAVEPTVSLVVSATIEALGKLEHWRSKLPASLQILDPKDLAEPKVSGNLELYSTRFRVFLSLRYLSTCILAYRQVLDLHLRDSDSNVDTADQMESFELFTLALLEDCARCCRLLIDIAKSVVNVSKKGVNINGAWWLSAHFVFNSSLVLLGVNLAIRHASALSSQPLLSNSSNENRRSMDDAVVVMQGLDRGNVVIARCMHALLHFIRLYDSESPCPEISTGTHLLELPASTLAYQSGFQENENGLGTSTDMGSFFDEFAEFGNFNFFSDPSFNL